MADSQEKDIAQVSQELGDEAQALSEIHQQGLSPEDKETWDTLVAEHQKNYAENADALTDMTKQKVNAANGDLQHRIETGDHNVR